MTFSTTIQSLRRELHLTQAELAATLGVDKQSVSNWECGRNAPWPAKQAGLISKLKAMQNGAPATVAPQNSTERRQGIDAKPACTGAPPCIRPSINERILKP